jgi:hypothetical protein
MTLPVIVMRSFTGFARIHRTVGRSGDAGYIHYVGYECIDSDVPRRDDHRRIQCREEFWRRPNFFSPETLRSSESRSRVFQSPNPHPKDRADQISLTASPLSLVDCASMFCLHAMLTLDTARYSLEIGSSRDSDNGGFDRWIAWRSAPLIFPRRNAFGGSTVMTWTQDFSRMVRYTRDRLGNSLLQF